MEATRQKVSKLHIEASFPSREEVAASVGNKERITLPYFSDYERTMVLAVRAQQLAGRSVPLVPIEDMDAGAPDFLWKVALKEIKSQRLPFIIARPLPSGAVEYWSAQELQLL